jgi:hypothetical protein
MNATTIATLLLAISGAGNFVLASWYLGARDRAISAEEQRDHAEAAAQACSRGTDALREKATQQARAAQSAMLAAQRDARAANARADAERTRRQAVPGNSCASAQVETREWLTSRRRTE